MTNEEKARAYDEALKDMRVIYPNLRGDAKLAVEHAFPQLAESEDERTRKGMIDEIKAILRGEDLGFPPQDVLESRLAYLEKQKNLAAIPDDLVKNYKLFCEQGGRELALLINAINGFNKQEDQKPAEWDDADMKEARNNLISVCRDWERGEKTTLLPVVAVRARYFLEHLTEPKCAERSEEDEKNLKSVVGTLWFALNTPHFPLNYERIIELETWLKSLRPQPHKWYIKKGHWYMCIVDKPEYGWTKGKVYQSPEDNQIETNYKGSLTNWPDWEPWFRPATRNEIPDKQPHWKPSEEQMKALYNFAYTNFFGDGDCDALRSIYEQLKKLIV